MFMFPSCRTSHPSKDYPALRVAANSNNYVSINCHAHLSGTFFQCYCYRILSSLTHVKNLRPRLEFMLLPWLSALNPMNMGWAQEPLPPRIRLIFLLISALPRYHPRNKAHVGLL